MFVSIRINLWIIKLLLRCKGNKVYAKAGIGFYTKVDLGIAKYHFEIGAGKDKFEWRCID